MAAGRNQVDYTDIRYDALTYKIDGVTILYNQASPNGSAQVGLAVTLSADDTVALTTDGSNVQGKLLKVEKDNFCTVQRWGFVTLPKGDSAPGTATRGRKIVGATLAAAKGYIRDVNTVTAAELGVCRGEIINVADAAAVVIDLG